MPKITGDEPRAKRPWLFLLALIRERPRRGVLGSSHGREIYTQRRTLPL